MAWAEAFSCTFNENWNTILPTDKPAVEWLPNWEQARPVLLSLDISSPQSSAPAQRFASPWTSSASSSFLGKSCLRQCSSFVSPSSPPSQILQIDYKILLTNITINIITPLPSFPHESPILRTCEKCREFSKWKGEIKLKSEIIQRKLIILTCAFSPRLFVERLRGASSLNGRGSRMSRMKKGVNLNKGFSTWTLETKLLQTWEVSGEAAEEAGGRSWRGERGRLVWGRMSRVGGEVGRREVWMRRRRRWRRREEPAGRGVLDFPWLGSTCSRQRLFKRSLKHFNSKGARHIYNMK